MPKVRVGEWWADATTNELGRGGDTLRLEPKAMEVLMVLASRAGRAVPREDLLAAVWPGVVVGDEALTQSIIKLRRAFGDNPRAPTYIETISKRGYRLIAPVDGIAPAAPGPADDEKVPTVPPSRPWRTIVMVGAAIVLALISAGFYLVRTQPPASPTLDQSLLTGNLDAKGVLTVTVLPFEMLGEGTGGTHLAGGISSDLMTDLSRLQGLRLIAASGTLSRSAAAGVGRFVVSGTVQQEAATLRINVRLTDARTNEQLWSQRFERPVGELFAVQNEISRSLTEQLPGKISAAERRRVAKRYTQSLEAYEQFLLGQAQFLARQKEENLDARASYAKAIELDPKFARAYAGLAMTYAFDRSRANGAQDRAALERALSLAETARQIDPDIPEVHWALALVHTRGRRHEQAIQSLHRAIALNPSYADAYALLAGIYTYIGQSANSVPLMRTALRLKPEGGYLYYLILGRAYLFMGDFEQARFNLQEALSRNAGDVESRLFLAATLVAQGNIAEAEWEAEEIRAQETGFATRTWLETYPMTDAPLKSRLLDLVAIVGL